MTEPTRRARPTWWGVALATVGTELRRWSRQPVAVVAAVVLPLAMAALVSLALGDDLGGIEVEVALVDLDRGPAADAFRDRALGDPAVADVVTVVEVTTVAEARRLVDDGEVETAVVLHEGLTDALGRGGRSHIEVVRHADRPIAADLVALVVEGFEVRSTATVVAAESAGPTGSAGPSGPSPVGEPWPLEVDVSSIGGQRLTVAAHYGPSLGLFFVLLAMGFAAGRLVADRQAGVVDRLATTPVSSSAVLLGRATAALAVGALSLLTVAVAMPLLFDTGWGPVGPVVAVSAAVIFALGGVAALVAGLARTPEQAQASTIAVSFAMALASGSLAPPGSSGRPALAELVPTTHALDAYATLTTGAGGLAAVGGPITVLVASGALGLALASLIGWGVRS